jgi:hypothetical protein
MSYFILRVRFHEKKIYLHKANAKKDLMKLNVFFS